MHHELSVSFRKPSEKYMKWAKKECLGVRKEKEGVSASGSCRDSEQNAIGDRHVRQTHQEQTTCEGVCIGELE